MSEPFLLDPGYEPLLGTTEYRRRFARQHLDTVREAIKLIVAIVCVVWLVVPPLLYLRTGIVAWMMFGMVGLNLALPMLLLVVLRFWWIGDWIRYWRMRRLAWHGELHEGTLLVARRVVIPAIDEDDYDTVAVEIEYRAETPAGQRVQGTSRFRRDDLLNSELPPAGTPVLVLVLNEKTHAML